MYKLGRECSDLATSLDGLEVTPCFRGGLAVLTGMFDARNCAACDGTVTVVVELVLMLFVF